jgi:hypothetical protein
MYEAGMTQAFEFERALKELQAGKSLTGKDSIPD